MKHVLAWCWVLCACVDIGVMNGVDDVNASGRPSVSVWADIPTAAGLHCDWVQAWPDAWVEQEVSTLDALNALRVRGNSCGERVLPVVLNLALRCAARWHSADMAQKKYLSHADASGLRVGDRAHAAGYAYVYVGENIGLGFDGADDVIAAWEKSDGHCRNMMEGSYVDAGLGVVESDAGWVWTLVLGLPQ